MFYDFITNYSDIFGRKNEKSFCNANAFHIFFNKRYWHISDINVGNFNKTLTNDFVKFEQPGPGLHTVLILLNSPGVLFRA